MTERREGGTRGSRSDRFADLGLRLASAVILGAAALYALVAGGFVFALFLSILTGAMLWELARMLGMAGTGGAIVLGGAGVFGFAFAALSPWPWSPALLPLPLLIGVFFGLWRRPWCWFGYGGAIILAAAILLRLRITEGVLEVLWLLVVVIATDVGGYLFGRLIGGAKLMPSVSPGKTWSGTIGGWVAAALVGLGFALAFATGQAVWLMAASLLLSMAAQAGDLVESALKRRAGIKDSSRLIPGHGGALDRFDGMIGALLVAGILEMAGLLPQL